MNAYVVDFSGVRWALPPAESWQMDYTAGVPCDSFWLRCPWDKDNPTRPEDWVTFQGEHEGERVFTGVVDECEVTLTSAGRMLEISGRGMAARLLDNEALTQDYQSATQADILRNHVTPYGIEAAPGAQLPPVAQFSVSNGSSEWSVVYEFARYYGGVSPRFDRLGRLVLTKWSDGQERVIGDSAPVTAITRRDRRYGVLSQVLVRNRWSGRVEPVDDLRFQQTGGMSRRVITMPSKSSFKATRYSGQFQLEKSGAERQRLEVTIAQPFCAWPGELVSVQRSGWDWNGRYRAVGVSVGMDRGGHWSRLELAPPDILL